MGDFDQLKGGPDQKSGKKKDKEGLAPGKVAGTDNYGHGGNGVNAPVPGKAAASQNLPAGPNGQPGKENGVDAKDGAKKEPNQAGGGKGQAKEGAAADAKAGKGKGGADANHNAAAAAPGGKKAAVGGANGKAPAKKGAPAAVAAAPAKAGAPIYKAKVVAPAQKADAPQIKPIAPVNMAALPPVNKNLADKWIKETGRGPDAHHAEIQAAVSQLTAEVQNAQNELQTYTNTVTQKIQAEVDNRTAAFTAQVTTPGRARVASAYTKMRVSVDASAQKALADIQTHKQNGAKTIGATLPAQTTALTKKLDAAKETVKAKVEKHAPTAKAEMTKFAASFRPVIAQHKLDANAKAIAETAKPFDPSQHSADKRDPGGALAEGKESLRKDVYKQLIVAEGKKLGDEYESTLSPAITDIEKNAPGWVILAIQTQIDDFNGVLGIYRDKTGNSVSVAGKSATDQLNEQEAAAKKAVTDAKTTSSTKIATEEKAALEAADAAGKELLDNSKNAGTELVDRLKKKSATDALAYATVTASIDKTLQKKGPHRFEQLKPQLDSAKAQLLKMHEANKQSLDQMSQSGLSDLTVTLAKFQTTYQTAIKNREDAAATVDAEIKKNVAKSAGDLGAHVSGIGTTMQDTMAKELAKIDGAVITFNTTAETALTGFSTKLKEMVDKIQVSAEAAFQEGLKKPFQDKPELKQAAEEQIKQKEKAGVTDAGKIRGAFDGWGTDEEAVFAALRGRSYGEIEFIHGAYNHHYDNRGAAKEWAGHKLGEDTKKSPLKYDIDDEMSGSDYKIAMAYLDHNRDEAIKLELNQASHGFMGTDGKRVEAVLRTCSEAEIHHLNTNEESKQAVMACRISMFNQCDGDVMTTLLDEKLSKEEKNGQVDAIRLFEAMKGPGTDEAKMTEIFEGAQTPEQRAMLRQKFNEYAAKRGWETGDAKDENNDALALAIKDDTSGGEQALFLEQAKVQRDDGMVKMAKAYKAADGGGTDEALLLESLDDEKYAEEWEKEKDPVKKKELEEAHKKLLDARLATITGTAKKDKDGNIIGTTDKTRGDIDGLIEDETDKCPFTWQELLQGYKEKGGEKIDQEVWKRHLRSVATGYLEYLCIQRTRQIGKLDPNIALAYACWGVSGTDEELINKAISKGGEPLTQAAVKKIKADFRVFWGVNLVDNEDEFAKPTKDPGGLLSDELGGRDWFKTRILLCGIPENARQEHYVNNLRFDYASSGALGGVFMDAMEAVGATEAKSTAEHSRKREQEFYNENFQKPGLENTSYADIRTQAKEAKEPDPKNPDAKKDPKEIERLLKNAANVEEFLLLSKEMEIDAEAYASTKSALIDAVITVLEVIGGVIISVATMGAGSPILAAFLANLAMSASGIVLKALVKGDQYGAGDAMSDGIAALGSAGFGALGEAKAVVNAAEGIGKRLTGTVFRAAEEGLEKGGMQLAKVGGKWGVELSKEGIAKVEKIVAAGAKNVMMSTGQEIYGFVTDEKTYEMKFGEALWGENSIGKRILAGAPKAFATGAVSTWINEHAEGKYATKGKVRTPANNALWNAVAEMGGNTAGFFLYPDNYQNAENFWGEFFKSNLQAGFSGYASGYLMHKNRHKKLGAEFIRGELDHEGLMNLVHDKTLDQLEQQKLAQFVMQHGTDANKAALPQHYKDLIGAKITLPALDANGQIVQPPGEQHANNSAANTNTATNAQAQAEPTQQHKDEAAKQAEAQKQEAQKKVDEAKHTAPENQPVTQQTQVSHEEKPAVVANENAAPKNQDEHKQKAPAVNDEQHAGQEKAATNEEQHADPKKAKAKNEDEQQAQESEQRQTHKEQQDEQPQNQEQGKQLAVGASMETPITRGQLSSSQKKSPTEQFAVETTNHPEVAKRAQTKLAQMAPDEHKAIQKMVADAPSDVHKNMIERAIAAGHGQAEIEQLHREMAKMTPEEVAARFTGAGVIQFYHQSCVPSAYQIAIADVDPFFAMQLRLNPSMVMDQQRAVLAWNDSKQTKRKDVVEGGDTPGSTIESHLADEKMGPKLKGGDSYNDKGSNDGVHPARMQETDLHTQLEKVTGHSYEILVNTKYDDGTAASFGHVTPHDRIVAAIEKGLPVVISQVTKTTPEGDAGHAKTIIGYNERQNQYLVRDPQHGTVSMVSAMELEAGKLGSLAVPKLDVKSAGHHDQHDTQTANKKLNTGGAEGEQQVEPLANQRTTPRTADEIAARKEEVKKAREETAARDRALTEDIHSLAPAKAIPPNATPDEVTALKKQPVDVEKVFDHITLGGGFAAVANESSRPKMEGENSIMIAAGGNPWDKAKNRFGQPVGESEVPNAKAGHKMKDTASDPDARFMLASEHAENVALNKNDLGLKTYPGQSGPAEPRDPATWPHWAIEQGANVRIPVVGPDGQTRYFYSKGVDVAVGPGAPRKLENHILDKDTLKRMQDAGVFFFGDQSFSGDEIKPGDHVINYGGGASGAWGTEAASKNAASVEWTAQTRNQGDPAKQEKLTQLRAELDAAHRSGDSEKIAAAKKKIEEFTFKEADGNGHLPRNIETGGAFDPAKQTDAGGNISRRAVDDCKKIEYVPDQDGKMKIKLTFIENHPDGPKEVVVWKDKMILSIGQDARSAGGPVEIVKNYEHKLVPIKGDPDPDGFQPVVGVQSPDGAIRILGAAATVPDISAMLDQNVMPAGKHKENLRTQASKLPRDSKGVVASFALAEKDIAAANGQLAKTVAETRAEQRRAAGLPENESDQVHPRTPRPFGAGASDEVADDQNHQQKKPNPKTHDSEERQTEKPDIEPEEQARARRSVGVKPSKAGPDTERWAQPDDRKGVPDHVPLSRQELRDAIEARYHETVKKYLKNVNATDLKSDKVYQDILNEMMAEPKPLSRGKVKEYQDRWTAVANADAGGTELRELYNVVERDDLPSWLSHVRHLPKEQQAKLAHMWRDEWRIFVRDMMPDAASKEILYQRDLAADGDRRGKRFDDHVKRQTSKAGLTKDDAFDAIIASAQRPNEDVNKGLTNSKDGIGDAAAQIRASRVENVDDQRGHLDRIAAKLRSATGEEALNLRAEYEALEKNPAWAKAIADHKILSELFVTLAKNQPPKDAPTANVPDISLLSEKIPQMLATQDHARAGKDQILQNKRERFERAVALAILNDPEIHKNIDAQLDILCAKAEDYIARTRLGAAAQEGALNELHTDASKGYGGGLGDKEQKPEDQAKLMLDVLKKGNIRERMLALQNFQEMLAKDALTSQGRSNLQGIAASTTHLDPSKHFTPEDAKQMIARITQYEDDVGAGKKDHKAVWKPLSTERDVEDAHFQYAEAKAQNMDTKLTPLIAEKVNAFLGNKLAQSGNVPGAESSPLARTTITVQEAIDQGLNLSEREIAAAGGREAKLNWVVGLRANAVDPNKPFIADAKNRSMPIKAGISGTTFRWMSLVEMLGGDANLGRLAAIASLQAADAHSFHEIAFAAQGFGGGKVAYSSDQPYANVGIDNAKLEAIAKSLGTTLDELNGVPTDAKAKK